MAIRPALLLTLLAMACGGEPAATPAPAPAPAPEPAPAPAPAPEAPKKRVFFVSPEDGATVKSPVKVVMGLEGMTVKEAGDLVDGTGHHHIIIGPAGIPANQIVPKDETHIHFGKGETETELELKPGQYALTMQFADGHHMSYGEGMASTIQITVEE